MRGVVARFDPFERAVELVQGAQRALRDPQHRDGGEDEEQPELAQRVAEFGPPLAEFVERVDGQRDRAAVGKIEALHLGLRREQAGKPARNGLRWRMQHRARERPPRLIEQRRDHVSIAVERGDQAPRRQRVVRLGRKIVDPLADCLSRDLQRGIQFGGDQAARVAQRHAAADREAHRQHEENAAYEPSAQRQPPQVNPHDDLPSGLWRPPTATSETFPNSCGKRCSGAIVEHQA